jgi:iron complex transport system ATP-binding protein
MLQARSLAFGFPGRSVGLDVSFTIDAGEILCVLGPNGSGKTTLFRTLLGLIPKQAGSVEMYGKSLEGLSRQEVARLAGYVPQGHSAYFSFSLREFVLMGRTSRLGAFAAPGRRDLEVADRALEALGVAHLAQRPITEVSGGERQLALVARALAQEPKILVMDEPTASLDFGNQVRVLERIRALAQSGISIVYSSHDPDHAFLAGDRALLLGEGRALEIGAPQQVIRSDSLQRLYGISVRVMALEGGRYVCLPAIGN